MKQKKNNRQNKTETIEEQQRHEKRIAWAVVSERLLNNANDSRMRMREID